MILSLGLLRDTIYKARKVKRITPEIVEVDCPECEGQGDWGKFLFAGPGAAAYAVAFGVQLPYKLSSMECIACKGTGRIFA